MDSSKDAPCVATSGGATVPRPKTETGQDVHPICIRQVQIDLGVDHAVRYHDMIRYAMVDFADYILDCLISEENLTSMQEQDRNRFQEHVALVRKKVVEPLRREM